VPAKPTLTRPSVTRWAWPGRTVCRTEASSTNNGLEPVLVSSTPNGVTSKVPARRLTRGLSLTRRSAAGRGADRPNETDSPGPSGT
jgi:hypothetical protein